MKAITKYFNVLQNCVYNNLVAQTVLNLCIKK